MARRRLFEPSPTLWLTLEKLVQQLLWLVLFLILAPILGPKPYGLFAIVMAFIGICEVLIVDAAVEALVTIPIASREHFATANILTVIVAIAAAAAAAGASSIMATVFEAPDLRLLFQALAPLPIISAFTVSPIATLLREMQLRALAVRSIFGLLVGGATAIVLAVYGAGVWALVGQILAQRAAEVILLRRSVSTRNGLGWSRSHYLELRGYAMSVGVSKLMAWSGGQIPRIILGWYLGPADLGLFTLATRLVEFVTNVFIVPQAWVARLSLRQLADERSELARAFRIVIREIAIIAFPVCVGLAAIIPLFIGRYLDQRWAPGSLACQIMILTGIPLTFSYCFTAAVLAARRPQLDSTVAVITNISAAVAVLIAAPYGLYAACGALFIQRFVLMPIPLYILRRFLGMSPTSIAVSQLPILIAAGAMGGLVLLCTPTTMHYFGLTVAPMILIVIGVLAYAPLALLVAPDAVKSLWGHALATLSLKSRQSNSAALCP
jgi:O-antigen/teichoic acid export membrane protein